jgi:hypothetical protein
MLNVIVTLKGHEVEKPKSIPFFEESQDVKIEINKKSKVLVFHLPPGMKGKDFSKWKEDNIEEINKLKEQFND